MRCSFSGSGSCAPCRSTHERLLLAWPRQVLLQIPTTQLLHTTRCYELIQKERKRRCHNVKAKSPKKATPPTAPQLWKSMLLPLHCPQVPTQSRLRGWWPPQVLLQPDHAPQSAQARATPA